MACTKCGSSWVVCKRSLPNVRCTNSKATTLGSSRKWYASESWAFTKRRPKRSSNTARVSMSSLLGVRTASVGRSRAGGKSASFPACFRHNSRARPKSASATLPKSCITSCNSASRPFQPFSPICAAFIRSSNFATNSSPSGALPADSLRGSSAALSIAAAASTAAGRWPTSGVAASRPWALSARSSRSMRGAVAPARSPSLVLRTCSSIATLARAAALPRAASR